MEREKKFEIFYRGGVGTGWHCFRRLSRMRTESELSLWFVTSRGLCRVELYVHVCM